MAAINSLLTTAPLNMAGGPHGSGVMGGGPVGGGFFPLFGWLVMLLVFALIGYVLVQTVRRSADTNPRDQTESALALLRHRYASGEIDADEYQSRKAQLES